MRSLEPCEGPDTPPRLVRQRDSLDQSPPGGSAARAARSRESAPSTPGWSPCRARTDRRQWEHRSRADWYPAWPTVHPRDAPAPRSCTWQPGRFRAPPCARRTRPASPDGCYCGSLRRSPLGARQGSCRLSHAAKQHLSAIAVAVAATRSLRSGFSVTTATRDQLRVPSVHRRGLRARASRYSACRRCRICSSCPS